MPRTLTTTLAILSLAAAARADDRTVVSAPKGFIPPKLIEYGEFTAPDDATEDEPGGDVLLDLFVNEDGKVDEVRIVSAPSDRLAKIAASGAQQARFVPGHLGLEVHRGWVRSRIHLHFGPPVDPDAEPKTSPVQRKKAPIGKAPAPLHG